MSLTQLYLRPYLFNNNNITFCSYSDSKQSYTPLHMLFKLRLKTLKDNMMVGYITHITAYLHCNYMVLCMYQPCIYIVWLHKGCRFNILGE